MKEDNWLYILHKMSLAERVLFLYRGFRILHNYKPRQARMSAYVNASRSAEELTCCINHYNAYWRLAGLYNDD